MKKLIRDWLGIKTYSDGFYQGVEDWLYNRHNNNEHLLEMWDGLNTRCNSLVNSNRQITLMYRDLQTQIEELKKND